MSLTDNHLKIIETFLTEQDFPDLYKTYEWPPKKKKKNNDTWGKGFPQLYSLEKEISAAARRHALNRDFLVKIKEWGGDNRTKNKVTWPHPDAIKLYEGNLPAEWLLRHPEQAISRLDSQIYQFGPTYCSKLLHFAVPQVCGALDTRLVQTFGLKAQHYPLLKLKVTGRSDWGSPSISKSKSGWPGEYGTWVLILQQFAQMLNKNKNPCPHPEQYVISGLRQRGQWLPADVETALFSYTFREMNDGNKIDCLRVQCDSNHIIKDRQERWSK